MEIKDPYFQSHRIITGYGRLHSQISYSFSYFSIYCQHDSVYTFRGQYLPRCRYQVGCGDLHGPSLYKIRYTEQGSYLSHFSFFQLAADPCTTDFAASYRQFFQNMYMKRIGTLPFFQHPGISGTVMAEAKICSNKYFLCMTPLYQHLLHKFHRCHMPEGLCHRNRDKNIHTGFLCQVFFFRLTVYTILASTFKGKHNHRQFCLFCRLDQQTMAPVYPIKLANTYCRWL